MSTSEKKSKTEFTEVALNKILAERFQKENSSFVLNETFHAHPIKMPHLVTDKPNKREKRFLDKDEALLEAFSRTLERKKTYETKNQSMDLSATLFAESMREREKAITDKDKEFLTTLRNSQAPPKLKYSMPITMSQEYGWFNDEVNTTKSQFYKPKVSCEETRYADVLIKSSTIGQKKREDGKSK